MQIPADPSRWALAAIILLAIIISLSVSSKYFSIENINLFRIASSEARLDSARNALLIIEKNPFIGIGLAAPILTFIKGKDEVTIGSNAIVGVYFNLKRNNFFLRFVLKSYILIFRSSVLKFPLPG